MKASSVCDIKDTDMVSLATELDYGSDSKFELTENEFQRDLLMSRVEFICDGEGITTSDAISFIQATFRGSVTDLQEKLEWLLLNARLQLLKMKCSKS